MRVNITRKRGDTIPERLTLELVDLDGNPILLSTLTSITLTVNSLARPATAATELLQIVGTAESDTLAEFSGAFDTIDIGKHFYDIEVELPGGNVWTPVDGEFNVVQDIKKT